ncbi:hypothetical protein BG015_002836 [Linnemannia schmuckeri]|uniref:RRM domain-containing protein n=1 Tax=Linnemannia schmuckeri TaxID=64567 RepID=A0A9P5RN32_9FUNG|nr:hypothetical protein BG015_002836 [Linnemannia schmuckeri]
MASRKDAVSKDALDLYDGEDDLLDYGDELEADLLDGDLSGAGNYDDLELDDEDDLGLDLPPLDAVSSSTSEKAAAHQNGTTTAAAAKEVESATSAFDDVAYDRPDYAADIDASAARSVNPKTNNYKQSTSNNEKRDASPSSASTSQKRQSYGSDQSEAELGGINRQNFSPSDDRSSYSNNYNSSASSSPRGGGRSGGLRGRGNQGYGIGSGRGNYQGGGAGRGGNMMGMGMNQQQMYAMQQMGMNMNMGLGMSMGMNGGRYSGNDGYGNQGMGYPYNGGAGIGGGAGTPGRTIHINPKFQNRAGVPAIPGATTTSSTAAAVPAGLDRALGQQQQQGSRQFYQDSGNGQSPGRGNQSSRSGSQDRFDGDRFNRNQQHNNGRSDSRDGRDQQGGSRFERGGRTDNSYRTSESSERDFGQGLSPSRNFGSRSGDSPRTPQSHSPLPSYNNNRSSPIIGGGSPGSISSRLTPGLKRAGGGSMEDFQQKAHKSSGASTPRGEHSRSNTNLGYGSDTGSVSFLRGRRDGGGGEDSSQHGQRESSSSSSSNSNAVPTGFVKVDNIPDSVSDVSIRQLAHGISGVDRVLTVSKKGDRTVILGFASVDEAKFFRRQINRTSIEGSLVTVTLTSA